MSTKGILNTPIRVNGVESVASTRDYEAYMRSNLPPDELGLFRQMIEQVPDNKIVLPSVRRIKIGSLNLFKRDVEFSPKTGINLIYGGNRNGKTTLANAIEFGIFGEFLLTLSYFANRTDAAKPSCRIEAEIGIGNSLAIIQREVFRNQGYHEAKLTPFKEELSESAPTITGAEKVQRYLEEKFGCTIPEAREVFETFYLREVPRNYQLKTKVDEEAGSVTRRRVFYRLLGLNNYNHFLRYCETKVEELNKENQFASRELDELKRKFSSEERARIEGLRSEHVDVVAKIQEFKVTQEREDESARKLKLESAPRKELEIRLELARKKRSLEEKSNLSKTLTTASIISDAKLICDTCGREFTEVAQERAGNMSCIACGLPVSKTGLEALERDITKLKKETSALDSSVEESQGSREEEMKKMQGLYRQLRNTSDELQRLVAREAHLSSEISAVDTAFPGSRFDELTKAVDRSIKRANDWQDIMTRTSDFVGKFTADKIAILAKRFSYYASAMLRNSRTVSLGSTLGLIDASGGDLIFEHLSHSEQNLLDIAYRLALLDATSGANSPNQPFLLLETPEEALDPTFRDGLVEMLQSKKNGSASRIIVTTSDRELVEKLSPGVNVLDLVKISTSVTREQGKQLRL
jgi:hypothetical protein